MHSSRRHSFGGSHACCLSGGDPVSSILIIHGIEEDDRNEHPFMRLTEVSSRVIACPSRVTKCLAMLNALYSMSLQIVCSWEMRRGQSGINLLEATIGNLIGSPGERLST